MGAIGGRGSNPNPTRKRVNGKKSCITSDSHEQSLTDGVLCVHYSFPVNVLYGRRDPGVGTELSTPIQHLLSLEAKTLKRRRDHLGIPFDDAAWCEADVYYFHGDDKDSYNMLL